MAPVGTSQQSLRTASSLLLSFTRFLARMTGIDSSLHGAVLWLSVHGSVGLCVLIRMLWCLFEVPWKYGSALWSVSSRKRRSLMRSLKQLARASGGIKTRAPALLMSRSRVQLVLLKTTSSLLARSFSFLLCFALCAVARPADISATSQR